jgi:hypothetical protein
MKTAEEIAWVIEHPNPKFSFGRYASLASGELRWTGRIDEALRFSRKIDAEQFCDVFMLGQGRVCDHAWLIGGR